MYDKLLSCRSKKGFTLMEMLIVVAIIAILIAIAIPVFSAQLEKARLAVDSANLRSATSQAVTAAMLSDNGEGTALTPPITWPVLYYGQMDTTNHTISVSTTKPGTGYNQAAANGGNATNAYIIQVSVAADFTPTASWVAP